MAVDVGPSGSNRIHTNSGLYNASKILHQASISRVAYSSIKRKPNTFIAPEHIMWKIFDWISDPHDYPMCWLKDLTTSDDFVVAQDVAELCEKEGRLAASIFCSSGAVDVQNFFPTIASQLVVSIPQMEYPVLKAVRDNSAILHGPVHLQVQELIIAPLLSLPPSHSSPPMIIVIESLDTCESVMEGVVNLAEAIRYYQIPIRIFVTSQFKLYKQAHWAHPHFRQFTYTLDPDYRDLWGSWTSHQPKSSLQSNTPIRHQPKVYHNLLSFLMTEIFGIHNQRYRDALQAHFEKYVTLDLVSSLVRCHQYRIWLLKVASDLQILGQPGIREALQKDEMEISTLLQIIINSDIYINAVLRLRGESAQNFVNLIQTVLDRGSVRLPDHRKFAQEAHRLLVKLSEASNILPSSLSTKGVTLLEAEAIFGGAFADIYKASYCGEDVALKRMRVFQRGQERQKIHRAFCREALVWQRLHHPYVLPFLGIDAESFPPFLCMVSPWMQHGTILAHMMDNGSSNVNVDRLLVQVAQGLEYLHSQNIIHGDLRCANILVDDGWNARIADFGLAVFADGTTPTHTSNCNGSIRWMAPELHDPESFGLGNFRRTRASDVFAFACVCIEIYTKRPPFVDILNDTAVILQVLRGVRPERPSHRPMSDDLWNLVEWCWNQKYSDRPSIRIISEAMMSANFGSW